MFDAAFRKRMRKFREAARELDRQLARKSEIVKLAGKFKGIQERVERLEKKVGLRKKYS